MIGVIPKPGQLDAVEEFFQLFKTPWEFYRPGGAYSAVISTCADVSHVGARLLVLYGAEAKSIDTSLGIIRGGPPRVPCLNDHDLPVPLYGEACTFTAVGDGCSWVMAGTEMTGVKTAISGTTVIRLGYDLFEEVELLLSNAQPIEHASTPTLDIHINMLRTWILEEGNPLLEIPPVPAGYSFTVCLTHDIDFIGIRKHKFDHTMFGFLYRSTFGGVRNLLRGRITVSRLLETWCAAASIPFVYLGWAKDFWDPFEWYSKAEKDLPATYFLIPFKHCSGEHVPGSHPSRRGTAYDVGDLKDWAAGIRKESCELGVHGLDAWHSVQKGRAELARVGKLTGQSGTGIRMHWLLQDANTVGVLEAAGFDYDSTAGYNETVGYRNGTTQVFRPIGVRTLLELPMHIQDGALFYPQRLDLSEPEAQTRCQSLIDNAIQFGGVLTLLWHDRSHGPERFWGDFYLRLLEKLKSLNPWFGTARQAVSWFRKRREVRFARVETPDGVCAQPRYHGQDVQPPFRLRVYGPVRGRREGAALDFVDLSWNGQSSQDLESRLASRFSAAVAYLSAVIDPVRSVCQVVQNVYDIDPRVRRKAEALVAAGYSVDVLALRAEGGKKNYCLNGVNVRTLSLGKLRGSLARYFFEYSAFFLWTFFRVPLQMARRRYSVIDVNSLPDFLIFAAVLARWMGAKLVLDLHEITPEFYMSKYGIGERSWTIRLLTYLEKISVKFADRVITINRPIEDLLVSRGLCHSKSTIIMNAVDEDRFAATALPALPPRDRAKFVMIYHGTLTRLYGLDLAIEALALVQDEIPGAELWILGAGTEKDALTSLAQERGLSAKVRLVGQVAPTEIPAWLSQCDAGILPIRRNVFLDFAFPNKLPEFIIAGKMVLVSRLKTIRHYFSEDALAYFEPNSPADLAKQMVRIYRDPQLRPRLAAKASEEYKPIRWAVMKERYLGLVQQLVDPKVATDGEVNRSESHCHN